MDAEPERPFHFILYFEHDSSKLVKTSMEKIPSIIQKVKDREPSEVSVIGHTDTKGTAEYNIELSLERAQVVAGILKTSGLTLKKLLVTSHGENDLLIPTADDVSEERNRRVEIMVR